MTPGQNAIELNTAAYKNMKIQQRRASRHFFPAGKDEQ